MRKVDLPLLATLPLALFLLAGCGRNLAGAAAIGTDAGSFTGNALVGIVVFIIVAVFAGLRKS